MAIDRSGTADGRDDEATIEFGPERMADFHSNFFRFFFSFGMSGDESTLFSRMGDTKTDPSEDRRRGEICSSVSDPPKTSFAGRDFIRKIGFVSSNKPDVGVSSRFSILGDKKIFRQKIFSTKNFSSMVELTLQLLRNAECVETYLQLRRIVGRIDDSLRFLLRREMK